MVLEILRTDDKNPDFILMSMLTVVGHQKKCRTGTDSRKRADVRALFLLVVLFDSSLTQLRKVSKTTIVDPFRSLRGLLSDPPDPTAPRPVSSKTKKTMMMCFSFMPCDH